MRRGGSINTSGEIEVSGRRIELSHLEKPLFDDPPIRKQQVVDYYRRIAGVMLPHIERRPLTLQRFPDGLAAGGFYQQNRAQYFPDWVEAVTTRRRDESGETIRHILCNEEAAIVYLANQDTVTFHAWLSRIPQLDRPDRLIFDLDPPGKNFERVTSAARCIAGLLEELGLEPFLMTTGSRGLHVIAPLRVEAGFDEVRALARRMAGWLARRHADELTIEQRKAKRGDRLYLDVSRNAFGQTAVAPYSLRALPGAPVATPLDWDELRSVGDARAYNLGSIFRRLGQKHDPWERLGSCAARLTRAAKRLERLERNR